MKQVKNGCISSFWLLGCKQWVLALALLTGCAALNSNRPLEPDIKSVWAMTGQGEFAGSVYVVSIDGDDANPGTLPKPFRTIQKAADTMQAGDLCLIRQGVYRETVIVPHDGAADKPLVFAAYPGEHPVVSGADEPSGDWTLYQGAIYKKTFHFDRRPFEQLFVDGQMYNEARWPNTGIHQLVTMNRAVAKEGTNTAMLADEELPAGDWTGATVHIVPGEGWISFSKTITSYVPGRSLTFEDEQWNDSHEYHPRAGNAYWLSGALAGLDAPGQWCLVQTAPKTFEAYLWLENNARPAAHRIEIKARKHAFDLTGRRHVHIAGLRIFAAAVLMDDAHHCRIQNCHLKFVDHFTRTNGYQTSHDLALHANRMGGSGNVWQSCSILYSAGNGILDYGSGNTVRNCIIRQVNYMATYAGCIKVHKTAQRGQYTGNTLSDSGRFIFWHDGAFDRCTHNRMHGAGRLTRDCGVTYTWGSDGQGATIAYNHVYDNAAKTFPFGIYIDNFCKNYTIHHNLIWDIPETAIMISCPIDNVGVYNNTILDSCGHAFNQYTPPGQPSDQSRCRVVNNLHKAPLGEFAKIPPQLRHNGNFEINPDGTLTSGSGAIDAGALIDGITDGFVGDAPDIGCYEYGAPVWTAGADWQETEW